MKLTIEAERFSSRLQALVTTWRKEGLDNQKLWNLKGIFRKVVCLEIFSRRIKQWSKWHRVRWEILASGYKRHQLGFMKYLSILSWMRLLISLLLVHVYLGPEKPKSTILHLSRQSLNKRDLEMLTGLPPNLSSPSRGSLKSLAITQGLLWRSATLIKISHIIHLCTLLGLA